MIMDEKLQQRRRRKGGFLHFLELQQRNVMRKTLPYHKHKDGSSKSPKSKQSSTSPNEETYYANKDANYLLKTIVHGTGRIANTGMRTLIGKKKIKGNQRKLNTSPLESELLPRTIPIHHSDNNGVSTPKVSTSLNENKPAIISSCKKDSSYCQPEVAISSKSSESILEKRSYCQPAEVAISSKSSESIMAKQSYCQPEVAISPKSSKSILEKQCEVCDDKNIKDETDHNLTNMVAEDMSEKQVLAYQSLEETNKHSSSKQRNSDVQRSEEKQLPQKKQNTNARRSERDATGYPPKGFTDMIQLFNVNMESLLKIAQDPNFAYCLQSQEVRSSVLKLANFLSLPTNFGLLSPNQNVEEILDKNKQDSNSQGGYSVSINSILDQPKPTTFDSGASSSTEPNNHESTKNVSRGFRVLRTKLKDIVEENRKEHRRISMDGILHKVPYGHKTLNSSGNDLEDHLHGKDDRCNLRSKSGKVVSAKRLMKSSSLHESLDRYSILMKSLTGQESQKLPQISKAVKEQNSVQSTKKQKSLQKALSLPEICFYDASSSMKLEPSSSMVSRVTMLQNGFSRLKKVASFTSTTEQKRIYSDVDIKCSIKEEVKQAILQEQEQESMLQEKKLVSNTILNDIANEGDIQKIAFEQNMRLNRKAQHLIEEEDAEEASTKTLEQIMPRIGNLHLSTIEDNNYSFPDDDIDDVSHEKISQNPTNSSLLEGSKIELLQEHIQHGLIVIPGDLTENAIEEFDGKQTPTILENWNYFRIRVDEKDEDEFQYVKDILLKSGFSDEDVLGEWYSPNQPISPSLFEEIEYSYLDLVDFKGVDTTLYHMLLFDLINEVLLEIYDASFSYSPFLSSVDQVRPIPVGCHVLEEVWAAISRYLNAQFQLDQAVESIVARDFMKNDGWMNLQLDTELVGLELEDIIVDELIDEVVIHLYGISIF